MGNHAIKYGMLLQWLNAFRKWLASRMHITLNENAINGWILHKKMKCCKLLISHRDIYNVQWVHSHFPDPASGFKSQVKAKGRYQPVNVLLTVDTSFKARTLVHKRSKINIVKNMMILWARRGSSKGWPNLQKEKSIADFSGTKCYVSNSKGYSFLNNNTSHVLEFFHSAVYWSGI